MKITMYVITHKKFDLPQIQCYKPLQVGAINKENLNYIEDCTGDNISIKNNNYCELTGMYWAWKNDNDSEVIGISHYRRYFTKQYVFRNKEKILNEKQIKKIFDEDYDIILPKKEIYKEKAYDQYCKNSGYPEDFEKIRKILLKIYPDYVDSFDKVLNQNLMYQFNMMICSKKLYNEYCEWLFNVLFELEKQIDDLDKRTKYQQRIYGFLSERLLNVWVEKNHLKVKKCRVINTDMDFKNLIRLNLRRIKNMITYKVKREKDNVRSN